jgi:hypothetical protein
VLEPLELRAPVRARHGSTCRPLVESLAVRGLMDHVRELRRVQDFGQIHERSRDGRDRDAVVPRDVALVQVAARLEAKVGAAAVLAGREDEDLVRGPSRDAPQRGRAQAREHRSLAGGENGGHPQALRFEAGMADGIDAAVDRMQASRLRPIRDRPAGKPELSELLRGHHSVLPRSEPGQLRIEGIGRG